MIKVNCSVHYPLDRTLTYMGDNTSSDDKFLLAKYLGVNWDDVNNVMWTKSFWKTFKCKTKTDNGSIEYIIAPN